MQTKRFEIWVEGYQVTGDSAGAFRIGRAEAETFREACIRYASFDKGFRSLFDAEKLTYWGCRLFDNEQDARKNFG